MNKRDIPIGEASGIQITDSLLQAIWKKARYEGEEPDELSPELLDRVRKDMETNVHYRDRDLLLLTGKGIPYRQLGEYMGCTKANIYYLVRRARRVFRHRVYTGRRFLMHRKKVEDGQP